MNCWEHKKCGRTPGGKNVAEMGVCPAYTEKAGQACWLVAGTFCGGQVQGTFAKKEKSCMMCDFYQSFDLAHRARVREQFGSLMAG